MLETKNIMVVDDEAGIRELLHSVLTEKGFKVTLACDGQDSWDQMKEKHFDLLITDIDMPRLDGIELMRKMKKSRRKEKVMVMTGRCLEHEDLGDDFPGLCSLLRKPFRLSFFIETVSSILASRGPLKNQPPLRANRRA